MRRSTVDLALAYSERSGIGAAKPDRGFGYCVQHRLYITGRAADDLEHVAGRGLVFARLVALGSAFNKLTLQIGYELFGSGQCAVGNRAHLWASSGTVPLRDHIVLDASHQRLSMGTVRAASANDRYQPAPSVYPRSDEQPVTVRVSDAGRA